MQMGHVMVQDYYRPDARNGYARGFILLSYMMTPITFGNLSGLMFGQELKDFLHEYAHTAAWWAHANEYTGFCGFRYCTYTLTSLEFDPRILFQSELRIFPAFFVRILMDLGRQRSMH
jgi:hypothetical protein